LILIDSNGKTYGMASIHEIQDKYKKLLADSQYRDSSAYTDSQALTSFTSFQVQRSNFFPEASGGARVTNRVIIKPRGYIDDRIYFPMQDYEKAGPFYQKAVDLSPNDADAFYNLGACAMNLHDFPGAMDAFSKAIALKSDFAVAYYQLGMVQVNQNNKEDAVKNLEKFLELAPDDPNAAVAKQLVEYLKK